MSGSHLFLGENLHQYRNNGKMLHAADPIWQTASDAGLADISVDCQDNNELVTDSGHSFVNMCSVSYLGLNHHPRVIEGAITALQQTKMMWPAVSGTRIRHQLLARLEEELSDLFGAYTLTGASCSALTAGILPLVASGHLSTKTLELPESRVMVFDRFCHFSMAHMKPVCADESLVLTAPHNDLNYLEDVCRKYPRVAYVADGAYSMGGAAPLEGLMDLQDRYGLLLYLDDSHSLSVVGEHGEGLVRSSIPMNELTIIVASLAKGFGTGGGIAMLGSSAMVQFFQRHAGPVSWSQNTMLPQVGASLASAEIHRSPELKILQQQLQDNIAYFDSEFRTSFSGTALPVRLLPANGEKDAVRLSSELFRRGFYSSAVFFPIVARHNAGLRIMLRADLSRQLIEEFIAITREATAYPGERDGNAG